MQTKVVHRVCKCERILFVQNVFGIWDNEFSFCRSSLINNNLSLPCYTTFCSFIPHSSLALSFCNCQSYGSFSGRLIETHIYSQCNLACVLSDEYLEEKLIIIVGGVDQREKCRGASVLNPNFEHRASLFLLLLPLLPSTHLLFCCKVMSVPAATLLKGISLFHVGCFFLRRVLAVHGNQIHRGPGIHTVMVVIAMGKTFRLFSPLKS